MTRPYLFTSFGAFLMAFGWLCVSVALAFPFVPDSPVHQIMSEGPISMEYLGSGGAVLIAWSLILLNDD